MTSLRFAFHAITHRNIVEIIDDAGHFLGTIYPGEHGSDSIIIISNHFDGEPVSDPLSPIDVPGWLVKFKRGRP